MANQTIPNLPAATSLDGPEELWAVQTGVDVRVTVNQISNFASIASGTRIKEEQLTVTSTNVLTNTTYVPNGTMFNLVVNGATYFSIGASYAFTYAANVITWSSPSFNLETTDTVYAVYTY